MAGNATFTIWNRMGGTLKSESYYTSLYEFGNTRFRGTDSGTGNAMAIGTKHMHSGKWYFEFLMSGSGAGGWPAVGLIASTDVTTAQGIGNPQNQTIFSWINATAGNVKAFGSTSATSYGTSFSDGDIINMAVDIDGGKVWWGKNNTYFNSGNPATGTNAGDTFTAGTDMAVQMLAYVGAAKLIINSGQDSNFSGEKSTGTNSAADGNGYGDFYYAPPTGFLSLNSANLPTSADIDPAETDNDHPQKQFGIVTYTGTGSTQAITGLGFQPDFVWIKDLSDGENHRLTDSSRGVTKGVRSDLANSEITDSGGVTAFGTDGFTVGDHNNYNASTNTLVAWCWRANGGTTSTNTSGTITSTVQANTAAGFSIVTYTGDGTDGASIGHGLSSGPNMIFVKNRDAGDSWAVYHSGTGNASHLILDTGTGVTTSSAYWNSFTPSSTIFKVGNDHKLNASTEKYVAYCWHDVEGFQKFGAHTGNGNTDGPFIYTGFKPRMIMIKRTDGSHYWYCIDSARPDSTGTVLPTNPITSLLNWDGDIGASTHGFTNNIHFFGNGFKMRTSGGSLNGDGGNFIYAAWGDNPYKFGNGF